VRLSRLVDAIKKIAGANRLETLETTPPDDLTHTVRIRPNTGVPAFGPSIIPRSEQHHESRQASAQYLRSRMFESTSRSAPLMNRRDRRRLARQFARNEYRRMMADDTNSSDFADPGSEVAS
jgi:hypothetical protein